MIRYALVAFGLVLLAWQFGGATLRAETIRQEGQTILLQTAPVDPRAFLLGDYMTLRYAAEPPRDRLDGAPTNGLAVLRLGSDGVAEFVRLHDGAPLSGDEILMRYTTTGQGWRRRATYGGRRYYFQSGTGERFAGARYGVFKVMPDGRALLSGLADADRRVIAVAGEAPATE